MFHRITPQGVAVAKSGWVRINNNQLGAGHTFSPGLRAQSQVVRLASMVPSLVAPPKGGRRICRKCPGECSKNRAGCCYGNIDPDAVMELLAVFTNTFNRTRSDTKQHKCCIHMFQSVLFCFCRIVISASTKRSPSIMIDLPRRLTILVVVIVNLTFALAVSHDWRAASINGSRR